MKALQYNYSSGSWGMRWRADYPKPQLPPGSDSVLVAVKAVGLNPVDYKLPHIPVFGYFLSRVVGLDISGVVVAVGDRVQGLKVGDEVFGQAKTGALTETVEAHPSRLAVKPPTLDHSCAAALPVVGITSLQSLRDHGKLAAGGRVLVIGASGGCGSTGVQIAKALGASHVTGVCSQRNADFVKSLGADAVHAYDGGSGQLPTISADRLAEEGFDVVYDTVTSMEDHNYEPEAKTLLRGNGQYVQINGGALRWGAMAVQDYLGIPALPRNTSLVLARVRDVDLALVAGWASEGRLKLTVEKEFPFQEKDVFEAFSMLKSRRTRGKLVVKME